MFKRKKREVLYIQILAGICTGCERCVNRCRRNVLVMGQMEKRPVAAIFNREACVGCGKCLSVCRADAIELEIVS